MLENSRNFARVRTRENLHLMWVSELGVAKWLNSQGKARHFFYKARLKQPLLTKVLYSQFKKYEIHNTCQQSSPLLRFLYGNRHMLCPNTYEKDSWSEALNTTGSQPFWIFFSSLFFKRDWI